MKALLGKRDLFSDGGRQKVLSRGAQMMLVSELSPKKGKELREYIDLMHKLSRDDKVERRTKRVERAARVIRESRGGGRHLRDIPPPYDGLNPDPDEDPGG